MRRRVLKEGTPVGFGQYSYHYKPSRPDFSSAVPAPKKRVRHVFDNPAHVAFHPRQKDGSGFEQDNARVSGGNWYFKTSRDGTRVMYSYRDSYPIASRFQHGKKIIFLLRSGKPYSVTTSGHMNGTRSAVPKDTKGVEVFTVPAMVHGYDHGNPTKEEHKYNVEFYISEIKSLIEQHSKARSSWNLKHTLKGAQDTLAELKRYARVFKLRLPVVPAIPKQDQKRLAAVVERERIRVEKIAEKGRLAREAYEAQYAAEVKAWQEGPGACKHIGTDGQPKHSYSERWECERARENEEWEAKKDELIAAWKRGEDVTLRGQYSEPALLRAKDGKVETSHHAAVEISGHAGAARLWRWLHALKDAGQTYQRNGHSEHIGLFVVESFDGETLKVGCHLIPYAECERIAPEVLLAEISMEGE